jgi:hypothetical protein
VISMPEWRCHADLNSKMLSALLTGVNRAYPYIDKDDSSALETLTSHIEELFKTGTPSPCISST